VPNRVNPSMNAKQALRPDAASQALAADPRTVELLERDDAVLVSGNPGDEGIRIEVGEFLTHVRE
jgi:hypothetical protein